MRDLLLVGWARFFAGANGGVVVVVVVSSGSTEGGDEVGVDGGGKGEFGGVVEGWEVFLAWDG